MSASPYACCSARWQAINANTGSTEGAGAIAERAGGIAARARTVPPAATRAAWDRKRRRNDSRLEELRHLRQIKLTHRLMTQCFDAGKRAELSKKAQILNDFRVFHEVGAVCASVEIAQLDLTQRVMTRFG
jgi:hypothetical protein